MSRTLSQITNQNTFGVWKTRTNDIIDVIGSVVTIGDSETNTGNVVITGDITSSGKLYIDTIQETDSNTSNTITVNSNLGVEGNLILDQATGAGKIEFQSANTPTWKIETSADHTDLDIAFGAEYIRFDSDANTITSSTWTIDNAMMPASLTADTTGNAGTATKWAASRTVTFANGDVTGNFSIDGSADVSDVELTVADNSHNHTVSNITDLGTTLAAKADLTGAVFTGDVQIEEDENIYFGNQNSNTDGYVSVGYGDFGTGNRIFSIGLQDGSQNDVNSMVINLDGKSLYVNNALDSKLSISGSSGSLVTEGDITAFGSVSDRNRKENIVKIDNALEKVSQISGYTFNYIGDDTPMTGVIAQELEEVLPEVVYETESPDGTQSKAVRHGNIVGLLIESIKELKAEIDELKKGK
jgi:hypothetical protein